MCLCNGIVMCLFHERQQIEERIASGTARPDDAVRLMRLSQYEAQIETVAKGLVHRAADAQDAYRRSRELKPDP